MEILVKMQVILTKDNGDLNLHLYERTNEVLAETEERILSIEDLCECEYEPHDQVVQGVEIELVKVNFNGEVLYLCTTVEDFESTLETLGLSKEEEDNHTIEEAYYEEIEDSQKAA